MLWVLEIEFDIEGDGGGGAEAAVGGVLLLAVIGDSLDALLKEQVGLTDGRIGVLEQIQGGVEGLPLVGIVGLCGSGLPGGIQRLLGFLPLVGNFGFQLFEDMPGHPFLGVFIPNGILLLLQVKEPLFQLVYKLLLNLLLLGGALLDEKIHIGDGLAEDFGNFLNHLLHRAGGGAAPGLVDTQEPGFTALYAVGFILPAAHAATAVTVDQAGEDVDMAGPFRHRGMFATDFLHSVPQLHGDDGRVFAGVGLIVVVTGSGGDQLALFDNLDSFSPVPMNHADIVVVGDNGLDAFGSPFFPGRRWDAHAVQGSGNLVGVGAVGVQLEDQLDDLSLLGDGFKGMAFALAILDYDLTVAEGWVLADEVAVLDGQDAAVAHDALLVLQELITTLELTLEHIPVTLVVQVVGVLQGDGKGIGIAQELDQPADVLQVATAETLGLHD